MKSIATPESVLGLTTGSLLHSEVTPDVLIGRETIFQGPGKRMGGEVSYLIDLCGVLCTISKWYLASYG